MDLLEINKLGLSSGDRLIFETYPEGREVQAELIFRSDLTLYCKSNDEILNVPFSNISKMKKSEKLQQHTVPQ